MSCWRDSPTKQGPSITTIASKPKESETPQSYLYLRTKLLTFPSDPSTLRSISRSSRMSGVTSRNSSNRILCWSKVLSRPLRRQKLLFLCWSRPKLRRRGDMSFWLSWKLASGKELNMRPKEMKCEAFSLTRAETSKKWLNLKKILRLFWLMAISMATRRSATLLASARRRRSDSTS